MLPPPPTLLPLLPASQHFSTCRVPENIQAEVYKEDIDQRYLIREKLLSTIPEMEKKGKSKEQP